MSSHSQLHLKPSSHSSVSSLAPVQSPLARRGLTQRSRFNPELWYRSLGACFVLLALCIIYSGFASSVHAATKDNTYHGVSLFVNGELQIMPQIPQLMNGNTLYIPVKQLDRVPGITVNYTSPLSLTGSRGTVPVNSSNSFVYAGTTYVQYKTLLGISELQGRYASSAFALFVWTTDEGKASSAKILANISGLPANFGPLIGQKMYPFNQSGAYWITDVAYDAGSTIFYITARNSGGEEMHTNSNYASFDFVLASALDEAQTILRGQTFWYDNRKIQVEKIHHLDKLTFVGFEIEEDNTIRAIVRKTNNNLYSFELQPHYDVSDMLEDRLFVKNPRSVYKWSNKVWDAIAANEVFIGMTRDQVILSWGVPSDYNTYTSSNLVYEQWIYRHKYLYFWNGKLSSAQSL